MELEPPLWSCSLLVEPELPLWSGSLLVEPEPPLWSGFGPFQKKAAPQNGSLYHDYERRGKALYLCCFLCQVVDRLLLEENLFWNRFCLASCFMCACKRGHVSLVKRLLQANFAQFSKFLFKQGSGSYDLLQPPPPPIFI